MHRGITVLINFKWIDAGFHQDPNHLVMTFVTGPVHRSVLANFLCILWFHKGVASLVVIASVFVLAVQILLLISVARCGTVFYEQPHNVFVTVT